jgi:hypothetical protein
MYEAEIDIIEDSDLFEGRPSCVRAWQTLKAAVLAQQSTNIARDEIPPLEILWQRMSSNQPRIASILDAVTASAVHVGAALMYNALVNRAGGAPQRPTAPTIARTRRACASLASP